jgi:hypothetical protein
MRLSILICDYGNSEELIKNLNEDIKNNKLKDDVQVLVDKSYEQTDGVRKNRLLLMATGKFIVFLNEKDIVREDFTSTICNNIQYADRVDCIVFNGKIVKDLEENKMNISIENSKWYKEKNIIYRQPTYYTPIKREIALKVGFTNSGEDFIYSNYVFSHLKKQIQIKDYLYTEII